MFDKLMPWKHQDTREMSRGSSNDPVSRLRHDFDQVWDRFWDDWRSGGLSVWNESRGFGSGVDFDDSENEYVMRAELPGFEPKDLNVQVSGNVLTVRAEHKEQGQKENGGGSFHRYGSFHHSFTLPHGVNADQIDAQYRNGVLELHLPKSEECQSKRIEVKSG